MIKEVRYKKSDKAEKTLSLSLSLSLLTSLSKPHRVVFALTLALIMSTVSAFHFFPVQEAQANTGKVAYVWGAGWEGALGLGDDNSRMRITANPAVLSLIEARAEFSTVGHSNFAILSDGTVYGWGGNYTYFLGLGHDNLVTAPTQLPGITALSQAGAELHLPRQAGFAVLPNGTVYAWGCGMSSMLGTGDPSITLSVPTEVPALTTLAQAGAEFHLTGGSRFAILPDGTVYGWGGRLELGLPGPGDGIWGAQGVVVEPTQLPALTALFQAGAEFLTTARTFDYHLVTLPDGTVYGWGSGFGGRLGTGSGDNLNTPTQIPALTALSQAGAEFQFAHGYALATLPDGTVYGWGNNLQGRLGTGNTDDLLSPTQLPVLTTLAQAGAEFHLGASSTFIVLPDGTAYGMGSSVKLASTDNSLPLPGPHTTPTQLPAITALIQRGAELHVGYAHVFAVTSSGPFATLSKHLQKPEGTPIPDLGFTFTFERNSFNNSTSAADIARIPNIPNRNISIDSLSSSALSGSTTTLTSATNAFAGINFTERGVYSWIVREVSSATGIGSNSHVVFSQAEYEMRAYIRQVPAGTLGGGLFYVYAITIHRLINDAGVVQDPPVKVDSLAFYNQYTRTTTGTQDYPGALNVSKVVTGYFANLSQDFVFNVTLTDTVPARPNFTLTARVLDANDTQIGANIVLTPGTPSPDITLSHNYRLVFDELVIGTRFIVTEAACPLHIASVVVIADGDILPAITNEIANTALSTGTHMVGQGRNAANFTNAHQFSPPTGLVIDSNISYLLFALPLFTLVAYLSARKRKEIEELSLVSGLYDMRT
jgi:large-conductance mechanosensitive channel